MAFPICVSICARIVQSVIETVFITVTNAVNKIHSNFYKTMSVMFFFLMLGDTKCRLIISHISQHISFTLWLFHISVSLKVLWHKSVFDDNNWKDDSGFIGISSLKKHHWHCCINDSVLAKTCFMVKKKRTLTRK